MNSKVIQFENMNNKSMQLPNIKIIALPDHETQISQDSLQVFSAESISSATFAAMLIRHCISDPLYILNYLCISNKFHSLREICNNVLSFG